MRKFINALRIRPIFNKSFCFVGVLPMEYNHGCFVMILPTIGLMLDWSGILDNDLKKISWS